MQRDQDLIRKVLLAVEASPTGRSPDPLIVDGFDTATVGYHVFILIEAGMLEGVKFDNARSPTPLGVARRLTWAGHEFLDAARDESRWHKVVSFAKAQEGTVTIAVLQQLLVETAKKSVGL